MGRNPRTFRMGEQGEGRQECRPSFFVFGPWYGVLCTGRHQGPPAPGDSGSGRSGIHASAASIRPKTRQHTKAKRQKMRGAGGEVVPEVGLEPTRSRGTLDFESSASTNSTTPAPGAEILQNPIINGVCGHSSGDGSSGIGESQDTEMFDKMTLIVIFPALRIGWGHSSAGRAHDWQS